MDLKQHLQLEKELLVDLEKSTSSIIESGVVIDDSGSKIINGTFGGVPIDAEMQTLLSESVLWKYGLSPLTDKYEELHISGEYDRIFYIVCAAFKLGRTYANILEKNYNNTEVITNL